MTDLIRRFVVESNAIEGIHRRPSKREMFGTEAFLALPALDVRAVAGLVHIYQPNAMLRDREGLDVRVGDYYPPLGGPDIPVVLAQLLATIPYRDPWTLHLEYERLHPFTDGNGRSGRAIWAWQMIRRSEHALALGFLHRFYYQTLERFQPALTPGEPRG